MGGLLLKLQNFKKVKLIFGHPVLQGVYIPAGKNLSSKRDFRKNSQEDFFASLSQETPIYAILIYIYI